MTKYRFEIKQATTTTTPTTTITTTTTTITTTTKTTMFHSLLNIVTLKQKARYDYTCDQYTRLFMPKLFLAASIIMTWNYFNDQASQ